MADDMVDLSSAGLHDGYEDEQRVHAPTGQPSQPQSRSIDEAASNIVPTAPSTSQGGRGVKRGRTSWVWKFFSINDNYIDENGNNLGQRAICNICSSAYSSQSKGGTGHLDRHLKNKHIDEISATDSNSGPNLSNFSYLNVRMRKGLALYVTAAEQPFTFGDDMRFEYFVQNYLNPAFSKVSRNTTRTDMLMLFSESKKQFISEIARFSNTTFAFTSDLWSGRNNRGYLCVIAHYIDLSWKINKKIIAFRLVEYPHNANAIFQTVSAVFREYELVDRVFSITFDNHSANTSSITLFRRNLNTIHGGDIFHVRCVCHIINLIVQDGLTHIMPQIMKIRNAILYISTSLARQQEFDVLCASYNIKQKYMNTDVKNRWNSTYLMLKSCRNHVDAISDYVNSKYGDGFLLIPFDWKIAFEFMKFLKVFYVATVACSAVRYPTSYIVLNHLYNISLNFSKFRSQYAFSDACTVMEEKFRKYFEDMPYLFILAAIIHPRIKLRGVEALLKGISDNLDITLPFISDVKHLLNTTYASYECKYTTTISVANAANSNPIPSIHIDDDPSWSLIASNTGISGTSSCSELVTYLERDYPTKDDNVRNFDILAFWQRNERTFPILSIMARDLLTSPVSSVASESAFSAGKRVLDDKRSRLAPDILNCLICLKDWEDERLGIQKQSAKDEFREYFHDSDIDDD